MRTVFLSESLVFPNQKKGKPVVVPYGTSQVSEAVIMQCTNPFSEDLLRFAKDAKVDHWVVNFTCSHPQKFLVDLAKAGVQELQLALIVCACSRKEGSRILVPKIFEQSPKLPGLCKDQGAALMRLLFEQWLNNGCLDFSQILQEA